MTRQTRPYREPSYDQLKEQERLILEATELISTQLEEQGVTKAELARRIGRSRAYLSQLLTGSRNMTLRTLADLGSALNVRVGMTGKSLRAERAPRPTLVPCPVGVEWELDPASFVARRMQRLRESPSRRHGVTSVETEIHRPEKLEVVG